MNTHRCLSLMIAASVCVCLVSYGVYVLVRQRAYAHVEELTRQHAHQVEPFVERFSREYDLNVVYFKVFEYDEMRAKVFIVDRQDPQEGNDAGGVFFYLGRTDPSNDWILTSAPEVVWSHAGSADGSTWPPYRLDGPYAGGED